MAATPRPRWLRIALLAWGALAAWNLYGFVATVLRGGPPNLLFQGGTAALAVLLVFALLAAGAGFARWLAMALVVAEAAHLAYFASLGAFSVGPLPAIPIAILVAEVAVVAMMFLPHSNAWFRERARSLRQRPWYAFVLVIVAAIVLVAAMIGSSAIGFVALLTLLYVPAAIFGRPHFTFGIGAGPADAAGVALTLAFYGFVLVIAGLLFRAFHRRAAHAEPRIESPVAAASAADRWWFRGASLAAVALLGVMVALPLRDRGRLQADVAQRAEEARAEDRVVVNQWPEVTGTFLIDDDGGKYGVRSSGRWRLARGVLEIDADETTVWDRVPGCGPGCGTLRAVQFVLRGPSGSTSRLTESKSAVGFQPIPALGPHHAFKSHRMVLPLTAPQTVHASLGDSRGEAVVPRTMPPSVLGGYWLAIDLDLGEGRYPANPADAFMFSDALAAKGLAAARCEKPRSLADAVERDCPEAIAEMLSRLPHGDAAIDAGDTGLRLHDKDATPLQIAVWMNRVRAARLLAEAGADVNRRNWQGYTLLMNAVRANKPDMAALLATHGAALDVRQPRDFDMTALMMAAAEGESRVVQALLAAGADKSLKDRDGHTAHDYAAYRKHPETAQLLN